MSTLQEERSFDSPRVGEAQVHTFLIADIRGYTKFTLEQGDDAAARLARAFAELVHLVVEEMDVRLVQIRGDEAMVVFTSARQALRAAVKIQERCAEEIQETSLPLHVGVGLDAGEAVAVNGGYRGTALNLAARLCSLAQSAEILATDTVINLARRVEGIGYRARPPAQVKGFAEPVKLFQILAASADRIEAPDEAPESDEAPRAAAGIPLGGFLGARPEGDLVARREELGKILRLAAQAQPVSGKMVCLAGEPGVGKTRLAQEVFQELQAKGFLLISGRCYESQETVPYYPFSEALRLAYEAASPAVRRQVENRWPHVGRLVPEAAVAPPTSTFGSYEDQQRLFWAITSFLQQLAAASPLALLLDDIHWADRSSLELLQHLAENTRTSGIFLLASYRDVEVGRHHPLERTLLDLTRERLVERIPIRRLDSEATAELIESRVGHSVPPGLSEAVYERTEGNAFFVEEVLRALQERGELKTSGAGKSDFDVVALEIPESVRAVIGQRLSRLTEGAQDLLREASVLGQTFEFDDLNAMSQRSEKEMDAELEEAMKADLIREMGDEGFTFSHALAQQTLYSEMTNRRRRQLHRQAGEALERLPERRRAKRAGELAHHFLEAHEEEKALPYALTVGDHAAEAFAHDDAYKHYHLALELARELEDSEREAEIAEKLGSLLTAMIQYPEALPMLSQAAEAYARAGDRLREGRTIAQMGRVYLSMNQRDEGIEIVKKALDGLREDSPAGALAALHSSLAKLLITVQEARSQTAAPASDAFEHAVKAADFARQADDGGLLAEAEVTKGSALIVLERTDEGVKALKSAIDTAREAGDLFSVCRALILLSGVRLEWGNLRESRNSLEQALEIAEQMDNRRQRGTIIACLGLLSFMLGDTERAEEEVARGNQILDALSESWQAQYHLLWQAWVKLALGKPDETRESLKRMAPATLLHGDRVLAEVEAELELLEEKPDAAAARLESLEAQTTGLWEAQLNNQMRSTLRRPALKAEAYLKLGRAVQAEETARTALASAETEGMRLVMIDLLRVLGASQADLGRQAEAQTTFERGLALAREVAYPYGEARLLLDYAQGLPEAAEATSRFSQAGEIFERLGAEYWAERSRI